MPRPRVFLDFSLANEPRGRVIFELFSDEVPKTCENFRALCTGEKGLSSTPGIPLYYKNSISHRIIKDFMIQAGDFTKRNGQGGESIYGASPFADEDLSRPLDAKNLLCMANKGPDTNGSQFFITLRECPHLNGKHVVFGKVIRGDEVLAKLAEVPVDEKSRPLFTVLISNCGELELRKVAKPAKRPSSVSEEEDAKPRRRSRRSGSADSADRPRHHHKKSKRKKDLDAEAVPEPTAPTEETEEEYDARLEREELERLEAQRKKDLERIQERYESDIQSKSGVRFKGRGRMMYVDPELSTRQHD